MRSLRPSSEGRTYILGPTRSGITSCCIDPGVPESLKELSAGGLPMGVCTSKRKDFAEKILAMFGVLSHFRFVDGSDIGIKKREQLAGLLQSTAIDHAAVMIGDREVDISSAQSQWSSVGRCIVGFR